MVRPLFFAEGGDPVPLCDDISTYRRAHQPTKQMAFEPREYSKYVSPHLSADQLSHVLVRNGTQLSCATQKKVVKNTDESMGQGWPMAEERNGCSSCTLRAQRYGR